MLADVTASKRSIECSIHSAKIKLNPLSRGRDRSHGYTRGGYLGGGVSHGASSKTDAGATYEVKLDRSHDSAVKTWLIFQVQS